MKLITFAILRDFDLFLSKQDILDTLYSMLANMLKAHILEVDGGRILRFLRFCDSIAFKQA